MLTAVVTAVASAACFALSTSLQHRAVTRAPQSARRARALLRYLVRRPGWHCGLLLGGLGFVLHALAVKAGALALVQPLMISGMIFAVVVRAALDRQLPSYREVLWAAVVAAGLSVFVVVSDPVAGPGTTHPGAAGMLVVIGAACVLGCLWRARGPMGGRAGGLVLGGAAGVLFGLTAGLLKMSVLSVVQGVPNLWPMAAVVVLGLGGVTLNQRAYQRAPLSVSMPTLNIVDVLVAITFGSLVFEESPARRSTALAVQAACLLVMGLGLRRLATGSPVPDRARASDAAQ
jgi:hypothetical protein